MEFYHDKISLYIKTTHTPCADCVCSNLTSAPAARPERALYSPAARRSVQPSWHPCLPGCNPWSFPEAGCCGTPSGWMSGGALSPVSPCPAPCCALLQTPRSGSGGGANANKWNFQFWLHLYSKTINIQRELRALHIDRLEWFVGWFLRSKPREAQRRKYMVLYVWLKLNPTSKSCMNPHKNHLCVPRPKHNKPTLGNLPLPAQSQMARTKASLHLVV